MRSSTKEINNKNAISLEFNLLVWIEKEDSSFPSWKIRDQSASVRMYFLEKIWSFLARTYVTSSKFFMIVLVTVIGISWSIKMFKINIFITSDFLPNRPRNGILKGLTLHEVDNGLNGFFWTEGLTYCSHVAPMSCEGAHQGSPFLTTWPNGEQLQELMMGLKNQMNWRG